MSNLDDIFLDPSRSAAQQLNAILGDTKEVENIEDVAVVGKLPSRSKAPQDSETPAEGKNQPPETVVAEVDSVRNGAPVLKVAEDRDKVRLLIITKNVAVRQLGNPAQKRIIELATVFAEVHVLILNELTEKTTSSVRLADNVWLYSTDSREWWQMGFHAYRIANAQLSFAKAFRADVIIAEDPFECGCVAYALARKYERPFQVHVLEDIFAAEFKERDARNAWRSLLAPFILGRADSVRTATEHLKGKVVDAVPDLASFTEVLPIYHDLSAWRDMPPNNDLRQRYPQFNFFILHISEMEAASHTSEVIHGVAPILRTYPTMALIIVGNGPTRPALEKQAIALGIQRQVEFEPVSDEVISHMKSANVLVHLSEDSSEDLVVLQAATVRLPIIATTSNVAGALFKEDESAYLCPSADPACVSRKLKLVLNNNEARTRLSMNAQEIVFDRIEQDYAAYLRAYRASIERSMVKES